MIDTPTQPELPPVHEAALTKLRMVAGEHFDTFLIVVGKNGERWSTYKDDDSAYGMASFICHNINKKWWESSSKDVK